ncbi:CAP domain-containing protein [Methanococcoides sp.]|uniref:CAP domain-containing protein n=1 Tax=Methanococcoides sp. TaxID=1966350 RepID=UPI00272E8CD8|nr:CAP domain-containing protein [Methanococcoides sp.]
MNKLNILLVSLLMVCLLVPAASADNPYSGEEQQMLDLINQEREENGLDPFRFNSLLNDVASEHSQEMIDKDYFSHNSYDGTSFSTRIRSSGYESYSYAENIAFRVPPSVTIAHEGLMNSAGHRANILNPSYNEIGIGIWVGEFVYDDRTYSNAATYTQNFGWGEPATDHVIPYNPYDENEDHLIDIGDVSAAIDDYRKQGPISIAELSELIDMYRIGEPYY